MQFDDLTTSKAGYDQQIRLLTNRIPMRLLKREALQTWIDRQIGATKILKKLNVHKSKANKMIINYQGLTDKSLEKLGKTIQKYCTHLKTLTFVAGNFGCADTTDQGMKLFVSAVARHIPRLKILSLDFFSWSRITDDGVTLVGRVIGKNITKIEQLNLRFTYCKITDKGIKSLGSAITRYFGQLRKLSLDFNGCDKITDIGAGLFGSTTTGHQLNELILDFSCWGHMTDKGLELVGLGIRRNFSQLKQLSLNFTTAVYLPDKITDRGIELFGEALAGYLTQLQQLNLTFSSRSHITQQGIKVLRSKLQGTSLNFKKEY